MLLLGGQKAENIEKAHANEGIQGCCNVLKCTAHALCTQAISPDGTWHHAMCIMLWPKSILQVYIALQVDEPPDMNSTLRSTSCWS